MKKKTLIVAGALAIVAIIPTVATALNGPSDLGPSNELTTDGATNEWMDSMHNSMWNTTDGATNESMDSMHNSMWNTTDGVPNEWMNQMYGTAGGSR